MLVLHSQGSQEVQVIVSPIRVGSLCLIQAVSPEPGCSATFDEGMDIIFSTNLLKSCSRGCSEAGERALSQKRALFSETRFYIKNHLDLSAGLCVENLHP